MRPVSKQRQRKNLASRSVREQMKEDFPCCMRCHRWAHDTHEISRGAFRAKSLGERCAFLRLCRKCHEDLHRNWSLEQQYCLKRMMDPGHYDRVRLNELRGREPGAIIDAEVEAEVDWVRGQIRGRWLKTLLRAGRILGG